MDWYACEPTPSETSSHCMFYRGHFLQIVDHTTESEALAGFGTSREVFVDGHRANVFGADGALMTTNCAYQSFDSVQEAAICGAMR